VRRFARVAGVDELLAEATGRESKLDPFRPRICQQWNEGLTDAAALHAELRQRGFTGSVRTVRRYVAPFRQAATAPDPAPAPPKTRQVTRWLLTRPDHLQPEEQAQLNAIRARCPHTGTLARHVASFMRPHYWGGDRLVSGTAGRAAEGCAGGKVLECGLLPGLHLATLARRAAGLISCPDHAHQRVLNLGTCSAKLVLILYGHADRTRIDGACPACAS
jgi:hypothetical protein